MEWIALYLYLSGFAYVTSTAHYEKRLNDWVDVLVHAFWPLWIFVILYLWLERISK